MARSVRSYLVVVALMVGVLLGLAGAASLFIPQVYSEAPPLVPW